MAIYPSPGFLLIELLDGKGQTAKGIYLPESVAESMTAKVLAVGFQKLIGEKYLDPPSFRARGVDIPHRVAEGDIIIYKPHTIHELPNYEGTAKQALLPFETCLGLKIEDEQKA